MEIQKIINLIKNLPDCIVYPPDNLPTIEVGHLIPLDLEEFYKSCGGILLFKEATFPTLIIPPHKFTQANPVIFSDILNEKIIQESKEHISWSWYLIGTGPNSQYITIDLSPERLGNVYNSFWIDHPGNSLIVAKSFTDLLLLLIETKGEYYPWDMSNFKFLGSPYK